MSLCTTEKGDYHGIIMPNSNQTKPQVSDYQIYIKQIKKTQLNFSQRPFWENKENIENEFLEVPLR